MVNGNSTWLIRTLIGAMFISIMALIGVVWGDINGDIIEVKDSVKELQRGSIKVLAMERELRRLSNIMDDIDKEDD